MLKLSKKLTQQIKVALQQAFPKEFLSAENSGKPMEPQLTTSSKPEFGDFQINGALALAKIIKKQPREIAEAIIEKLVENDDFLEICEDPIIAGPGFINLKIKLNYLVSEIQHRLKDPRLGIPITKTGKGSTQNKPVIIDFSSPNIAKEMHVGHLRSTIIGDSLARILEFLGHKVIRLNHVGDWGTQFGMLIKHLKNVVPEALTQPDIINLGDLVTFYREAKKKFDDELEFQIQSREEVVKLQRGDKQSTTAWELLCDQSRKEFQKIYDQLNVELTERGESFYNPYLQNVVDELLLSGLLVTDDGAKCVFLEGINSKTGKPLPLIVQKRDGGFNYATTDLAAIRYRLNSPPNGDGAYRIIYVTDAGQSNHFKSVFQVAKRANWIPKSCTVQHVPFGLVQGEDGKKLKTRSGETVKLKDLINEAISRAKADLQERLTSENRKESKPFIENVSKVIGIASIKYADLSQNRLTNYQFSFDRMLSLQGNTAPYLLYALVRIAGIARKGGSLNGKINAHEFKQSQEINLIKELLKFDEVLHEVEKELLPNRLCSYLFELSQVFNRFYDQIPVLKANEPFRSNRLALCRLTASTLKLGLNLLGIPSLERM